MTIQDRWGATVFTTDNALLQGWNGLYNGDGNPVPEGAYFYLLQIETYRNQTLLKTGAITLLR
jgi:gliding motility-associated-like protein